MHIELLLSPSSPVMNLKKIVVCLFSFCAVVHGGKLFAQADEIANDSLNWKRLLQQPVSEQNFREACDLMQKTGRTDLKKSYEMLNAYVSKVKPTGNRRQLHILLMGWARAKESTGYFDDAEKLYYKVLSNTNEQELYYREALVYMILMYGEWGKIDSLDKYVAIGQRLCTNAGDKENLSFIYGFKAMTRFADTASMREHFEKAISLANDLPDKNALFTARYNYAYMYCQNNPQLQASIFEELFELAQDSTLNRYPRKLYERTAFTFRNAGPSVYYNLMQINLVLADYDNAWRFAELFYDATIRPNPNHINAPYFNADLAMVKAYQGDLKNGREYLDKSFRQFKMNEDSIPYLSYFIASGLLAEHSGQNEKAARYFQTALRKGNTQSQHLIPPEINYADRKSVV